MGYIYKIINDINNKIYVGKTDLADPDNRWKEHLHDYKTRKCEKRPLYDAMNKYGVENFHFEVIEETDIPEERERYWIDKLRTYVGFDDCNGYNATLGGDGKSYLGLDEMEVIEKYFKLRSSLKVADYYGATSKTILNILHKNNISVDLLQFPVLKLNQDTFEIVEKIEYKTELKQKMGVRKTAHCLLTNICKPVNGYLWIFEKDYIKLGVDGISKKKKKSKYYYGIDHFSTAIKIICINDNKIFESMEDGRRYYNIKSTGGISECCSGKKKSCGKHPVTGEKLKWMYYEDYLKLNQ